MNEEPLTIPLVLDSSSETNLNRYIDERANSHGVSDVVAGSGISVSSGAGIKTVTNTDKGSSVTDATLSTSDITTNNVSTSKHGFAPKAPNDATKFLDGTGAYSVPAGGTSIEGRSHGTATTSIPGGFTPTKVDYNSNDFATGITWDGTNHRFTCVTAGKYIVIASVGYNGSNASNQYEVAIYLNGGQNSTARQHSSVNSSVLNINVTDILSLSVSDYVEAVTQHSDVGAVNILNSSLYTWIAIAKI